MEKVNKYVLLHLLLFAYSFCGVFSKLASGNEFLSLKFAQLILHGIFLDLI